MLLALDVGNTHIAIGLFKGKDLKGHWRITTYPLRTSDEYAMLMIGLFHSSGFDHQTVQAVICSCVVPPLTPIFARMGQKFFNKDPQFVSHEMDTGLKICIDQPQEAGADRIVNAVAGYNLYGESLIIVDFGTATTVCAVSSQGEYLGGTISPGLLISSDALFSRTAKLPKVELLQPKTVIGKNTTHSMQSGLLFGFAAMVDGLILRMKQEMGGNPRVIATGGLAHLILPISQVIQEVQPYLTLEGLRLLYERKDHGIKKP